MRGPTTRAPAGPAPAAAAPERFFTVAHYGGHPHVLVRLTALDRDELADLLEDAWRVRAPKRLLAEHDARKAQGSRPLRGPRPGPPSVGR